MTYTMPNDLNIISKTNVGGDRVTKWLLIKDLQWLEDERLRLSKKGWTSCIYSRDSIAPDDESKIRYALYVESRGEKLKRGK